MKLPHSFPHKQCAHFIEEFYIGFRMVSPKKGDIYNGKKYEFHTIVFMLEGEVIFSYDDYLNRHFKKGDLFFIPQASLMFGYAIEDSRMLVLTFNTHLESLCDTCSLKNYLMEKPAISYDFAPLKMTATIWKYVLLIEDYLLDNMRCAYLHKLKQRELFVILQYHYTVEEVLHLFYPIVGMKSFRAWVMENYTLNITQEELARRYSTGIRSFERKFNKEFGMNFRTWMLKQKAKQIRLMLSTFDVTVNDIIREFNFADKSTFYRFCKREFGCTVTQILKEAQE